MGALPNPRHEAFVQKLVKPGDPSYLNYKQSYKATYPSSSDLSAECNSSRLIRNEKVHDRFLELMEKQGLTDSRFNKVHSNLLDDQDGNLRFKALRLAHELKGRLGQGIKEASTILATQININIESHNPNDTNKLSDEAS